MKNIPSSWTITRLAEILAPLESNKVLQQGWSPRCENFPSKNNNTWGVLKTSSIQPGEFIPEQNKQLPATLAPKENIEVKVGDILMTCAGPRNRCGVACLIKATRPKLMFSGKIYRFRSFKNFVNSKYLELYLCSQEARVAIDKMKTGINDSGLNLTHDRFIKLLIPVAPLNEQHRIVAKIEELFSKLDKGIESLKAAQAQLKNYRQALLKDAFEGKLTAHWRSQQGDSLETPEQLLAKIQQERAARYQQQLSDWEQAVTEWEQAGKEGKKPSKPQQPKLLTALEQQILSDLPSIPNNWKWEKLGWMTLRVEYGTSEKSINSGSHIVLRMGNIQNGKFDWNDLVFSNNDEEIKKYLLKPNDVLFNRTNSPELVGKTAIYKGEKPAIFAGYLIRINHFQNIIASQYLNLYLNSAIAKQYGNTVKTDGVNQSNINGEKLSNYPFPYCSIQEQEEIVKILESQLSKLDKLEDEITLSLKQSQSLRQAILKKAFAGELVPQDPADEPASELLARIAEEKAALAKQTKALKTKKGTPKP